MPGWLTGWTAYPVARVRLLNWQGEGLVQFFRVNCTSLCRLFRAWLIIKCMHALISSCTLKTPQSPFHTSIILYGCETWTLLTGSEKRIQAFETKCLRNLLRISYLDHKTNDWMRSKINSLVGPQESLLATVKRRELAWFELTC